MADGYIDLSPIIRAIDRVNSNVAVVNNNLSIVSNNVDNLRAQTMSEINKIKAELVEMERQQRLSAALQRAITEVIRVRQELEQKYGTHKLVRENMLGILQASDLALISESTISRCTEELMISAPNYWLAPCLIALAGWISNNESLAKRAVKEAYNRDKEKTCLLFALITRRVNAGRIKAGKKGTNICFEWLREYFEMQDPRRMKTSIIAYVDAYTNGIFGEDKDNICQEHIIHWLDVLKKENPNFEQEQKSRWLNKFSHLSMIPAEQGYAALKQICVQYDDINNYISRITASENPDPKQGIKSYFSDIIAANVDTVKLINDIDEQLRRLVERYEDGEESKLRDEDAFLNFVKDFKGDEGLAQRKVDAIKARQKDEPVDFSVRLSNSILDESAPMSARKTAFYLLKPYIQEAYSQFITENKNAYPKEIDFKINEQGMYGKPFVWTGKTENGENKEELEKSLTEMYESNKKASIDAVTDEQALKDKKTGKILCFTILLLPFGIMKLSKAKKALKANQEKRERINNYYTEGLKKNKEVLNNALEERANANEKVENFLSDSSNESINI